jgi:hypothetical protein
MAPSLLQCITIVAALAYLSVPITAAPTPVIIQNVAQTSNSSGFLTQNGLDAQQLNFKFFSLQQSDNCTGEHYPLHTTIPAI